jgi:hypothetical protein
MAPAIWVELNAAGTVSDTAQEHLFLRLHGGPNADGTFVEPDVALDVGSDYLVLYTTPRDALMGYPTTAEHGVLQVSDGRLEGLFGTYSLSSAEFIELYDTAQAAVEHLRSSDPSEMVVVDWESECPTETLLLPTPYDTSEQSHDGPLEGTEYGRPDAAGM